ncbi:MAG: hypothetical protein HY901_01005 [Deltaproteobacteria bacterium]|nr:hypothetical protein [Deltaproteobacteria bacterium]
MAGRQGFATYLKAAFANRWNLLFLGAGAIAAAISGHADVALPLLGAAEIAYLGMIGTNSRFHRAIDSQLGAAEAAAGLKAMKARFDELYRGLDPRYRQKFDELRARCTVLADLAGREPSEEDLGVGTVAQEQLSGVNRLLWVYLKLLHTKGGLENFFQSIDPSELDRLEKDAKRRLEELPKELGDAMAEKKRKSIEDTLSTVAARRDNIKKARENHDYVTLEMERIAAKLTGIAELAVNRQDPGLLTHDVDDVARSVQATEEAIGELQSFSGLTVDDVAAPEILSAPPQRVHG